MANSVGPDETAHDELSQLDLHCLQKYLVWYAGLKRIKKTCKNMFGIAHTYVF